MHAMQALTGLVGVFFATTGVAAAQVPTRPAFRFGMGAGGQVGPGYDGAELLGRGTFVWTPTEVSGWALAERWSVALPIRKREPGIGLVRLPKSVLSGMWPRRTWGSVVAHIATSSVPALKRTSTLKCLRGPRG